MNLLKTSALNGIAVLIKTATMFILNKILAIYVGPSGYAAIGQFQNFIQIVTTFAGGAINTAVVKYTAEYYDSEQKQKLVWKTAGSIVLIFSMIVAFLILIFQKQLAIYIFKSTEYQSIFIWFAIFLIFFNFNALFLAILNGKKEILRLVIANIAGSVFALITTGLLAFKLGLYGALVALSINQSIVFLVTLFLCYKASWFKLSYLFGKIDKALSRKFGSYVLMALTSALCMPISQILIRSHMVDEFGVQYAGYWEAMIRLSGAYLMLVTTTLSVYYLPRLSELKDLESIKKEVYTGYKFIFPVALTGALVVYVLRDWIISLLFTPSFLPMKDLFLWQMIGDSLKIGSWIIAYLMLGQAMTKLFILSEILASISLVGLTYICTNFFGFEGVSIAYLINYALYWVMLSFSVFNQLRAKER
ncbi:O-antigen translocase [Psychrobacter namhaensis]|uniref:O-antigen translocase n=1 Tax=Psychrobacter namhaensis TaxID=292734 RepID=UPI0018E03F20|nr:O-antigen translocase [Psychrobacter namhaensis]